ncbi:hypothetical protein IAR50_002395 [Cryptococcus sp. DSM 104548]
MPVFPAALKPQARAAYRDMLRSARITFQGDPARHQALLTALRATFSSPTLTPPPSASAEGSPAKVPIVQEESIGRDDVARRINEWKDVAKFLRKNVVQGVKSDDGVFKLRVHEDTELGDNTDIKKPAALPTTPFPNRNRRRCGETAPSE